MDLYFYGDQGGRSQYLYGINIVGNPELTEYEAYSNFISESSEISSKSLFPSEKHNIHLIASKISGFLVPATKS